MKVKIYLDTPATIGNPIILNMPDDTDVTARSFFDTIIQNEGSLTTDLFLPPAKIAAVIIDRSPA